MPEEPAELIEEMHHHRRSLEQHLEELQYKVAEVKDWRILSRRHPQLVMTVAATAGVLLAMILFGRGVSR